MKLVFLHSSDTHGYLLPTDYQSTGDYDAPYGLSRVASAIKAEKAGRSTASLIGRSAIR